MVLVAKGETVVVAGTKKGVFVAHSRDRRRWKLEGPFFEGVECYHAMLDPRDGKTLWAAPASMHWGPTIRSSRDWGARWTKPAAGPKYPEKSGLSVSRVWHLEAVGDELWAGVEPAGLFRSLDGGRSWEGVDGFNAQEGRDKWTPGGGGLCLHTILPYPGEPKRMVACASAVGIFGTNDGGASWRLMNGGIRAGHLPGGETQEAMPGSCPHKVVRDAKDPAQLYMQNHFGVYKRRRGDAKWTDISKGLPSRFGFPMVAHPHEGGTVYTVPLEADANRVTPEGAMAVWRTKDAGKTWQRLAKGLPQQGAFHTILREGMATDGKDPAGLYVGTTTGQLYASRDEGGSWDAIATTLPPILSVQAAVAR